MLNCSTRNAQPQGDALPGLVIGVLVYGEVARKIVLFILEAFFVEHCKAVRVGPVTSRLEHWVYLHLDIVSAAAVH